MTFNDPLLLTALSTASSVDLDGADFGVVRLETDGTVISYNAYESALSGLSPDNVKGRNFFTDVAPCTNNFMVAERFHEAGPLDEMLDYVFTYRMKPTKVRLRLLKSVDGAGQFLAVQKT